MNKSLLTFNMSVSGNKEFMESITFPIQIMPLTNAKLTDKIINNYPIIKNNYESVIHTSYITRVFKESIDDKNNDDRYNVKQYIILGERINYKNILLHLPDTINTWENLGRGISALSEIFNESKCRLLLEMPAFKKGFIDYLKSEMPNKNDSYIYYYIESVLKFKKYFNNPFQLVFDTAHLFANGFDSEEQASILEKYKNEDYIIHLNGNEYPMYHSDKHVPIYSQKNKMKNTDKLLNYLSDQKKLLIAEITGEHGDWKSWEELCNIYNFDLIPFNERLSI